MTWNKIHCNNRELQLMGTLSGGQSFRWKHNKETDEWTGIFSKTLWKLRQKNDYLEYEVLGSLVNKPSKSKAINKNNEQNNVFVDLLKSYFRLDMSLGGYYKEWSEKDELFKSACKQFYGIRMLAQEPVENLFSFICSQNNHISSAQKGALKILMWRVISGTTDPILEILSLKKATQSPSATFYFDHVEFEISSLVEKLCTHYGKQICEHDGVKYYAFPEVEKLLEPEIESQLRGLGFGYRAKFIQKSASQIVEWGGEEWFRSLQDMKYKDARQELMKLHGIGPKVADCICLMSLNHLEALPVDTHVYQIAAQNYLPHLRGKKNVTEKMYTEIGDHFRSLYGDMAGWAHTVLFCADLKMFQKTSDDDKEVPKKKRKTKC